MLSKTWIPQATSPWGATHNIRCARDFGLACRPQAPQQLSMQQQVNSSAPALMSLILRDLGCLGQLSPSVCRGHCYWGMPQQVLQGIRIGLWRLSSSTSKNRQFCVCDQQRAPQMLQCKQPRCVVSLRSRAERIHAAVRCPQAANVLRLFP